VVEAWRQAAGGSEFVQLAVHGCHAEWCEVQEALASSNHFWAVHRYGYFGIDCISLAHLVGRWQDEDYAISVACKGYGEYSDKAFIDTLDDWQFFGPDSERPQWYTGKYWGRKMTT